MKQSINYNYEYYKDLDTNFKLAVKLCEQEYSHSELLTLLRTGNIPQKQIAALKFDYVKDQEDALALINNLTGCDGKIREAVALKINSLICSDNNTKLIFAEISPKIFANATIDINANICRLIVNSACMLKGYEPFASVYTKEIIKFANESLKALDNFIFRDKKYIINKQIFKLYWCLEALNYFYDYADRQTLLQILEKSSNQTEYTIREKAAQILSTSNICSNIKNKLVHDNNYYVRQALHHPSFF